VKGGWGGGKKKAHDLKGGYRGGGKDAVRRGRGFVSIFKKNVDPNLVGFGAKGGETVKREKTMEESTLQLVWGKKFLDKLGGYNLRGDSTGGTVYMFRMASLRGCRQYGESTTLIIIKIPG